MHIKNSEHCAADRSLTTHHKFVIVTAFTQLLYSLLEQQRSKVFLALRSTTTTAPLKLHSPLCSVCIYRDLLAIIPNTNKYPQVYFRLTFDVEVADACIRDATATETAKQRLYTCSLNRAFQFPIHPNIKYRYVYTDKV